MGTGEFNAGDNTAMEWHPIQGGVEILQVASCYRHRDKLRPTGPLGSYADFTFTLHVVHCMETIGSNFLLCKLVSTLYSVCKIL